MQIELIGCTGAGKSTLIKGMMKACREQGIDTLTGDEFVIQQLRLNRIKSYLIRTLFIDIFSLVACLLSLKNNSGYYKLISKIIWYLPFSTRWLDKINITRNALKKIGIYEIIRKNNVNQKIIFVDEGTVHTAHNFFVQASSNPSMKYFSSFIKLVPLPDVVIYLKQDETVLIERTLMRGHKRIRNHSYNSVKAFIKEAVGIFTEIELNPRLDGKLIIVNEHGNIKNTLAKKDNFCIDLIIDFIHSAFNSIDL